MFDKVVDGLRVEQTGNSSGQLNENSLCVVYFRADVSVSLNRCR